MVADQVRTGPVRILQVETVKVRTGQVRKRQTSRDRSSQIKTGQVQLGQAKLIWSMSNQVGTGHIKLNRSSQKFFLDTKCLGHKNLFGSKKFDPIIMDPHFVK